MRNKKICVLGLGYIGLPTAAMFATHGNQVVGVDINDKVVNALNQGKITIEEPYLDILVQAAVKSGNLIAKGDPEESDAFIVAVPTPITKDKKADMTYVKAATESIVPYIKKGDLIILESTSPTGTVKELMCPILEKSGLKPGEDFYIGHSPERVLPGQILMELVNNNRIVGGINEISSQKIRDLYRIFVNGEIFLTDATTAEMCKMMENTYRDINIAIANELSKICENIGINVWEVIKLCNKHPRVNIHTPGPGVGGHCLAVDPWFIVEKNEEVAKLIKLSRMINDSMPHYVFGKIKNALRDIEENKKVVIYGITYKPNVDDIRESPIIELIDILKENNYEVSIYDPYVEGYPNQNNSPVEAANGCHLALLGVNHNDFVNLPLSDIAKNMKNKNFYDTRNFFDKNKLKEYGFNAMYLGDGNYV